MSWSADDRTGGTRRSRPGRSHSAAVTDWLGRTSSVPSSRHTGHGGGSYPAQSLQLQQQQEQARLVLTLTGWRRRALFGLLLTLTVIVIINLSLTLWLLRSMQFSLVITSLFIPFPFWDQIIIIIIICPRHEGTRRNTNPIDHYPKWICNLLWRYSDHRPWIDLRLLISKGKKKVF